MSKEIHNRGISWRAAWRDAAYGVDLLKLDRAGWAWEWLKRNPEFITAMDEPCFSSQSPERTGRMPRIVEPFRPELVSRWGALFC